MNNKGINLIALVITIIVMIMLAGIAINNSYDSYDKALEAKAKEENSQITKAITDRFGSYQINKVASPIIGESIPEEYFQGGTEEEVVENVTTYLINLFRLEGKLVTDDEVNNKTTQKAIRKFVKDNIKDMEYTRIIRHAEAVELGTSSISLYSEFLVNYYKSDVVGPIQ